MKDPNAKPSDRRRADEVAIVPTGKGEILLYQTEDGRTRVECRFRDETIWLTQAAMAELFQTTTPNVNIHLKNIYGEGELAEEATVKDYLIVRSEGVRQIERRVKHYNLDAILGVGYRVRSQRGTQFRRWATERLREYLVKGFVLDEFLQFNERDVLTNAGRTSKAEADAFAEEQYDRFAERRRAFKEAQGEQDTFKALEDAARNLPARGNSDDKGN